MIFLSFYKVLGKMWCKEGFYGFAVDAFNGEIVAFSLDVIKNVNGRYFLVRTVVRPVNRFEISPIMTVPGDISTSSNIRVTFMPNFLERTVAIAMPLPG